MKYLLKAISANTKDMRTGLVLIINDCTYVFNTPDGFQRTALTQKLSFHKAKYVFISNLKPNYFAGFPGFYMSARESLAGGDPHNGGQQLFMTLLGPKGIKELLLTSFCFMGRLS